MPHRSRHIVSTKKGDFGPRKFLATVGEGKQVLFFAERQTIFTQGDAADAVFYERVSLPDSPYEWGRQ